MSRAYWTARVPSLPTGDTTRAGDGLQEGSGTFIGRELELAKLASAFASSRVLTLVGPGGVGKSRLALRLVDTIRGEFPDGVHYVDGSTFVGRGNLTTAVAELLEKSGVFGRTTGQGFVDQPASRRLLLVLDNCQATVGECAQVAAQLLRACPGVQILATCRELLRIRGEVVWRVPSLRLPPPGASGLADMQKSDAVQLLAARLRAQLPGFVLNRETMPAVARICQRVEGLPLALEIVAMHVPKVGLSRMASRIDRGYVLRLSGTSDAPVRQQSVLATLDWSYTFLAEPERLLLARLASFVGGWTLDAAEVVCSDKRLTRVSVAAALHSLVSASFIVREDYSASTCFRFPGITHHYAFNLLRASGEEEIMRRRQAEYMATLAERFPSAWRDSDADGAAGLAFLTGNFRAAFRWALRAGESELAAEVAAAQWGLWYQRKRFEEGNAWFAQCFTALKGRQPSRGSAMVGTVAGHFALLVGNLRRARALLTEALQTQQALGNAQGESLAAHLVAVLELWSGNNQAARSMCDQSQAALLRVHREDDLTGSIQLAVYTFGARVAVELGDARRASELSSRAETLAQVRQSRYWHARALQVKALVAARDGENVLAIQLIEHAIESQHTVGDRVGLVDSLCALGRMHLNSSGSTREGLNAYADAMSVAMECSMRIGLVWALEGLARGLASTQPEDAVRVATAGEALRDEIGCALAPGRTAAGSACLADTCSDSAKAAFKVARGGRRGWDLDEIRRMLSTAARHQSVVAHGHNPLTPREREIVRLLLRELSHREISAILGIRTGTVRSHVEHILKKLDLHSRAQLAAWALHDEGRLQSASVESVATRP